jgi:chlorobactene glucosyltransferase
VFTLLWLFVGVTLVIMAVIVTLNTLTFTRLERWRPMESPFVSILVPARDEAQVIGQTVRQLLAQDYPNFELIILDDQSSDCTGAVAVQAANGDSRLRIIQGALLPVGWLGKNWACQQLAGQARGELLVFSDADVGWGSGALSALVGAMQARKAGVFTVWPTQVCEGWAERLVVPLMMLAVLAYLPELGARYLPFVSLAAANGQCLAFRRKAYQRLGGHAAVRAKVVEDVAFARLAKRTGLRVVMALGSNQITCRMYHSWAEVRQGFGKNILAGHGDWPGFLVASTIFHWLIFLGPWMWLFLGWELALGSGWPWSPLSLIALGLGIRAITAAITRQRVGDALLMPFSVIMMSVVAAQALIWHFTGGPYWKGRLARIIDTENQASM